MEQYLLGLLICPCCHHELDWQIKEQDDDRIERAQARCVECGATYPVRNGIGVFLTPELPCNDLWEQVESSLNAYIREHLELERRLMDPQVENACVVEARPTPASRIFEGARADGLPVAPTELEWCVLQATVPE